MPKCSVCQHRYKANQINKEGLCPSCASDREEKIAQKLKDNLDALCGGRGKEQYQKIFDAFVRTYPEALITGVGCNSEHQHLLMYLDGKPMYYATFDPLRNSVSLEPYEVADANPAPAPKKEYSAILADRAHTLAGLMSFFSIIFAMIVFLSSCSPASSLFFGFFSLVSAIGCLTDSGNTVVSAGVLMALCGMLGDSSFILPAVLVIYGGMKF